MHATVLLQYLRCATHLRVMPNFRFARHCFPCSVQGGERANNLLPTGHRTVGRISDVKNFDWPAQAFAEFKQSREKIPQHYYLLSIPVPGPCDKHRGDTILRLTGNCTTGNLSVANISHKVNNCLQNGEATLFMSTMPEGALGSWLDNQTIQREH